MRLVDEAGGGLVRTLEILIISHDLVMNDLTHSSIDRSASVLPVFGLRCHSCTLTN